MPVYNGIAYRQSQDPAASWLVSIVLSAEELLSWAGIPRRAEEHMAGFQRAFEESRVARAKEFFSLGVNQSPTALVVGIHPRPKGVNRTILLEFTGGSEKDAVRPCTLAVDYDASTVTEDQVVASVREQVVYRLSKSSSGSAQTETEDTTDDAALALDDEAAELAGDENQDADSAEDAAGGNESDGEIELGRSLLTKLLAKLDEPEWCTANIDALRDIARPATIIDGQHRVKGAEACERDIPFAVCAIYDCEWAEQVFQFTVVNYTQKGIPDQFITANAALSLTADELAILRDRLVQANVQVVEYELMKVVQFDSRSPFYDLINLTEKSDPNRIGYKTMVRIAKRWYAAGAPVVKQQLLPNLYPTVKGKGAKNKRLQLWKDEHWGLFFLDFWSVVRDHYASHDSHENGHSLWQVGHSNLMVAIVLHDLQDQFFRNLGQQDEEYFDVSDSPDPVEKLRAKLRQRAQKFVEWFPPAFFASRWGMNSLNMGSQRVALTTALGALLENKGKYQYDKSALVSGKTS